MPGTLGHVAPSRQAVIRAVLRRTQMRPDSPGDSGATNTLDGRLGETGPTYPFHSLDLVDGAVEVELKLGSDGGPFRETAILSHQFEILG